MIVVNNNAITRIILPCVVGSESLVVPVRRRKRRRHEEWVRGAGMKCPVPLLSLHETVMQ